MMFCFNAHMLCSHYHVVVHSIFLYIFLVMCSLYSFNTLSAELMESRGNGHTFLHPLQRHLLSTSLLGEITLSEVNAVATELCEHLSHIEVEKGVLPAAVVACAPLVDRAGTSLCFAGQIVDRAAIARVLSPLCVVAHNHLQRFLTISHDFLCFYCHTGAPFSINEQEIANVIEEALRVPLHPLQDKAVPTTLLTAEQVAQRVLDTQPAFVGSSVMGSADSASADTTTTATTATTATTTTTTKPVAPNSIGVVQAQLSNGMKVNMKTLSTESQRVSMRLYVPGGYCEELDLNVIRDTLG